MSYQSSLSVYAQHYILLYSQPILKSLHWLKISERIHYKILSITYKYILFDNLFTYEIF